MKNPSNSLNLFLLGFFLFSSVLALANTNDTNASASIPTTGGTSNQMTLSSCCKSDASNFTLIAPLISAFASIANLVLVIVFFVINSRNRDAERKAEVAGFWIEDLIMRKHHDFIHQFFDKFEERLKQNQPLKPAKTNGLKQKAIEEILAFKQELRKIDQQVIEHLQWIHADFNSLNDIRNEIEDLVTTELSRIPGINAQTNGSAQNPEDRLADLRRRFFQTIHQTQTKVILKATYLS